MKTKIYLLLVTTMLMAVSCRNNDTQETDKTQSATPAQNAVATIETKDGVSLLCMLDSTMVFGFADVENEMSAELFRGSYNDSLLATLMPTGASESAINVYLAINSNHKVLFDAGLGADKGGHLLEKMKDANIDPTEITDICLTHLHGDHIGGLLLNGSATFPNATLYLSQEEYDAWSDKGALAKNNDFWKQVMEAYKDRIITFHNGEQLFDGMVVTELAPGHTPGHTTYTVNGKCLIAGDIIHAQDLQLEHPQFCARYDMDPAQATSTRTRIFEQLRIDGRYLAGAHCYEHFINLSKKK